MVLKRARWSRVILLSVLLILILPVWISRAQDNGVNLIQTAEYNIGLDCPVTATLDPAGTTLWTLMDNCGQSDYAFQVFNVADGTPVDAGNYADALAGLDDVFIDLFITPLAFTPDGDLSIRYNDPDTYASADLIVSLDGGAAESRTSASFDALLASLTDYPEFSVYSPDHTRVVAVGTDSLHVIDVQAETEIVEIPAVGSADYAIASFSADSAHLYVVYPDHPEDMNDLASTLTIYRLPDSALLRQVSLPSSAAWISPDERYAALQLFSSNIKDRSELIVMDLESGQTSAVSNLLIESVPVTKCLNDGRDVSDLGFWTDSYFTLASLNWLPDSSGLVLTLSYDGDGAEGDAGVCIFNYSRLRTYQVDGGAG